MELEQIIMTLIFLNMVLKRTRKKRRRKLYIYPIFTFRITNGAFFTLYDEPEKDERSLDNYFSMFISSCSKLHNAVQDLFQKTDTKHGVMSYCQGGTCSGTKVHV
jgi:hypothetical protein